MKSLQKPISYLFLIYFLVLFIERGQSLVLSYFHLKKDMFSSSFDIYVNSAAMVSLLSFVVMVSFFNKGFWASLISEEAVVDYSMLTVTAGVLLVSGMVHTEYTIAGVQFASYGALIAAMVLRVVEINRNGGDGFSSWYSLIYCVMFSMAIPVVYKSNMENPTLFHAVEIVVSLVLVFAFTCMLRAMFVSKEVNLLSLIPFILMVTGDFLVLSLRWKETVNGFVLVFAVISTLMFIAGRVLLFLRHS